MATDPQQKTMHTPSTNSEVEVVKDLVLEYIRGEATAGEIRIRLGADKRHSHLLDRCSGRGSLPQQLLEAVGLSAYDMGIAFAKPPVTTRDGLRRNLRLLTEGRLAVRDLCEWSTDRIAWDIVDGQGCEDDVVRLLANEFTHGEDYAQRIVSSQDFLSALFWHLDHTRSDQASLVRVGLFVQHWKPSLKALLSEGLAGSTDDQRLEDGLRNLLSPVQELAPTIVPGFLAALRHLKRYGCSDSEVEQLIVCTSMRGSPEACADDMVRARG